MALAQAELEQTEAMQPIRTSSVGALGEPVGEEVSNVLQQCYAKAVGRLELVSLAPGDGGGDAAAGTPRAVADASGAAGAAANDGLTAACAPEPPSQAKRFRAKTVFDGRNYGEDYLLVNTHDGLEILPNADASNNWIYVRITSPKPPGLRLEGWVPDWLPEEAPEVEPTPAKAPLKAPAVGKAAPPPAPPVAAATPGAPRASALQGKPPPGLGGEAEEDDPWWHQPDPWEAKAHQELVASVRAALEKRGQNAWHDWCQRNNKRITDPSRCHITVLNNFLKDLEAHDSRKEEARATGRDEWKQEVEGPWETSWSPGSVDAAEEPTQEVLAERVKAVQRGPGGREAWHEFCSRKANGVRDPKLQPAQLLQEFLDTQGKDAWARAEDRRDWAPQDWAEVRREVHRGTLRSWKEPFGFINNHGLVGVGDVFAHRERFVTMPPFRDLSGSVVEFQVTVDRTGRKTADQIRIVEGKVACKYHMGGYCRNGSSCTFAHERFSKEGLKSAPDSRPGSWFKSGTGADAGGPPAPADNGTWASGWAASSWSGGGGNDEGWKGGWETWSGSQEKDRGGEPATSVEHWPADAAAAGSAAAVQGGAQPDATFDEDASALLAWLPESCRYEADAAVRRGDVQQLSLDVGRRPRALQGNKWVFLSDTPLSAVDLRELFARTEGAVESGEIGGIKSSLHRVLPVLAPGGRRATGVTVRPAFARAVSTSGAGDIDFENTGSLLVAGPRGSGKSTWLRHAACRLSGQAEVLVLDPEGELGGLGGECGAPHAALGAARRAALPAGSRSAEAVVVFLRQHRPQVLVVDDMDVWFGSADQDVAKAVMGSGVKLVCGITVENGPAMAIQDSTANETLASTALTGCRDRFSAVIEIDAEHHIHVRSPMDFQ